MKIMKTSDVRTLKPGFYLRGIGFVGCYNTGLEPTIRKITRSWLGKKENRFVVGPELWASEVTQDFLRRRNEIDGKSKRIYRSKYNREARMFKTRKPAVEYYVKLNNEIIKQNEADCKKALKLKTKANKGDIAAAMDLADMI